NRAEIVGQSRSLGLAGGVNVRTPCGPRRIENIRKGDLIVTRKDGLQPVRLVFCRTVSDAEMAADPSLAPVALRPRAVGPMMPQLDMRIASGHRILVPGYRLGDIEDDAVALVQARDIAGTSDAAYVDRSAANVSYFNLVFDTHQVFTANGLPVESFLPNAENIGELEPAIRCDLLNALPHLKGSETSYPAPEYPVIDDVDYRPAWV
ncbi:MAG: Hint domain-containing protein, partial [Pseudomonadota bacterium]